jgi:hypothetical protein
VLVEADVLARFQDRERGQALVVGKVEGMDQGTGGRQTHVHQEGPVLQHLKEGGREGGRGGGREGRRGSGLTGCSNAVPAASGLENGREEAREGGRVGRKGISQTS